jgi:hypothetical protein
MLYVQLQHKYQNTSEASNQFQITHRSGMLDALGAVKSDYWRGKIMYRSLTVGLPYIPFSVTVPPTKRASVMQKMAAYMHKHYNKRLRFLTLLFLLPIWMKLIYCSIQFNCSRLSFYIHASMHVSHTGWYTSCGNDCKRWFSRSLKVLINKVPIPSGHGAVQNFCKHLSHAVCYIVHNLE